MSLQGKNVLITGASRGIGKAIALKLAQSGANIIIAAKSVDENPKLGGTIYSAAKEIEEAGGKALPIRCDIRNEEDILKTIREAVSIFGGIDMLVNKSNWPFPEKANGGLISFLSAIWLFIYLN